MLDMTKPEDSQKVIISIVGTQKDDSGEENRIEFITSGQVYENKDISYITYEEKLSVDADFQDFSSVILTFAPDRMTLTRSGGIEQIQEFVLGKLCVSNYNTVEGVFSMGIFTNLYNIDRAEDGIIKEVNLEYKLEIGGQWQSNNTLSIVIKEEKRVGH